MQALSRDVAEVTFRYYSINYFCPLARNLSESQESVGGDGKHF